MRPTKNQTLMAVAETIALRSTCTKRLGGGVGAVIASVDGSILSTGYNGSPTGCPHCDDVGCNLDDSGSCMSVIHAEMNAIINAAVNGTKIAGSILYTTHFPCARCAAALVNAKITTIYWKNSYRGNSASKMLRLAGIKMEKL